MEQNEFSKLQVLPDAEISGREPAWVDLGAFGPGFRLGYFREAATTGAILAEVGPLLAKIVLTKLAEALLQPTLQAFQDALTFFATANSFMSEVSARLARIEQKLAEIDAFLKKLPDLIVEGVSEELSLREYQDLLAILSKELVPAVEQAEQAIKANRGASADAKQVFIYLARISALTKSLLGRRNGMVFYLGASSLISALARSIPVLMHVEHQRYYAHLKDYAADLAFDLNRFVDERNNRSFPGLRDDLKRKLDVADPLHQEFGADVNVMLHYWGPRVVGAGTEKKFIYSVLGARMYAWDAAGNGVWQLSRIGGAECVAATKELTVNEIAGLAGMKVVKLWEPIYRATDSWEDIESSFHRRADANSLLASRIPPVIAKLDEETTACRELAVVAMRLSAIENSPYPRP